MNLYLIFPSPDGTAPGDWLSASSFSETVEKIDTACAMRGMDPACVTVINATDPSTIMDYAAARNWAAAEGGC